MPRNKTDEAVNEEVLNEEEVQQEEDVIRPAFDAAVEAGKDEDGVKLDMISAGATFKNVTRLFNQYMIDAGFAISSVDRQTAVEETLTGKDLSTEEGFAAAVVELVKAVKGATERSAAALARAYAKKNELDCYAKAKGAGAGKSGFAAGFYGFLIANPKCTVVEATAYVNGEGDHAETSANTQKHLSHYLNIHKLVNTIAGVEVEVEAEA